MFPKSDDCALASTRALISDNSAVSSSALRPLRTAASISSVRSVTVAKSALQDRQYQSVLPGSLNKSVPQPHTEQHWLESSSSLLFVFDMVRPFHRPCRIVREKS